MVAPRGGLEKEGGLGDGLSLSYIKDMKRETFKDRVADRRRARRRGDKDDSGDIFQGALGPTLFGIPWYFWIFGVLALGYLLQM